MFVKIFRGLLFLILLVFYVPSVLNNPDGLYAAIVLDRGNLLVLVIMLYLISDYVKVCGVLCVLVALSGILIHGFRYREVQLSAKNGAVAQETEVDCSSSWYSKLNSKCN